MNLRYAFIALMCCLLATVAQAETVDTASASHMDQTLLISGAYQPLMPSVMPMHAGYLTVKNISPKLVTIVGASSPEYESVSIHHSMMKDGMSSMKMMPHLSVEPGQEITLAPGGMHLMLHQSKTERQLGDSVPMVFQLDNGDEITFEMTVAKR